MFVSKGGGKDTEIWRVLTDKRGLGMGGGFLFLIIEIYLFYFFCNSR